MNKTSISFYWIQSNLTPFQALQFNSQRLVNTFTLYFHAILPGQFTWMTLLTWPAVLRVFFMRTWDLLPRQWIANIAFAQPQLQYACCLGTSSIKCNILESVHKSHFVYSAYSCHTCIRTWSLRLSCLPRITSSYIQTVPLPQSRAFTIWSSSCLVSPSLVKLHKLSPSGLSPPCRAATVYLKLPFATSIRNSALSSKHYHNPSLT